MLLVWLLVGLAGAGVAGRYFFEAFPEAAVHFKVTRAQALTLARDFATAQGAQLDGYDSTVVFNVEDDQKTYLEREMGLQQANRLMSSEVNVWYWEARFFRPLQKEEYRVLVDPGGRIVGYQHVVEEAAPGENLERGAAQARAEQFLRDTLQVPLAMYTFLPEDTNSVTRPQRTDWSFTWERTGFRAKDAPYRLEVTLQGGRIGGYGEFLKVPEEWLRSYASLHSWNNAIETVAIIPYALLLGAAISVVFLVGRRGQLHWGATLKLGLFIMALYFAMQLNQWPLTRAGYNTNTSYSSFVAGSLGEALGESFLMSLLLVIAFLPGELLYRAGQPGNLRLGSVLTRQGLRTKEFFRSGVIGICLAGAHIGYITLFYIVGRRWGVWAPQDLQYSDTLSTALPWIYPLTIAIYAAGSEEFLFRLFAIRYLRRITKWRFLAVVLPAFAWGFLHANYPQEPPYIRGIEVGMIGIVAGLVMLRWGIVATLVWHYSVDAFLISLSLMRSPDLYSRVSGAMVGLGAFFVVGIAGVFYLARGGFADPAALLNRAEPLAEETPVAAQPVAVTATHAATYEPLTAGALAVLGLCGALGIFLVWAVKPQAIGDFVRFSVDARQAEAQADEVLRGQKVDPSGYRRAATIQYTFDPLINEYLRRRVGIAGANRIYREQVPSAFWAIRYFRDSQAEEYLVVLRPDGAPHSVHHTLAESATGANLSKDEALARAEAFLQESNPETRGFDFAQWKLVESTSDKLPARTDHNFTWEQIAPLTPAQAGEEGAHERVSLKVQGEEVSGYRVFVHVPEEWVRQQQQTTLSDAAQIFGLVVLAGSFVISVFVVFFRNLKDPLMGMVRWKPLARWMLIAPLAAIAMFLTMEPQYLTAYPTEVPFRAFVGTTLIGLWFATVFFYSAAVFLFGLAWFFLARTYGVERLTGVQGMPARYYRDAFAVGAGGALAVMAVGRLAALLARIWVVAQRELPALGPQGLDFSWPAVHALGGGVNYSLIAVGVLALALGFASCYLRRPWMQTAVLLAFAVVASPGWGSAGDFVQKRLLLFAVLALIWWGSRKIARFNLLGYLLAAMVLLLATPAADLLREPNPFYRANGWGVAGAGAALLLWPLAMWKWKMRKSGPLAVRS